MYLRILQDRLVRHAPNLPEAGLKSGRTFSIRVQTVRFAASIILVYKRISEGHTLACFMTG